MTLTPNGQQVCRPYHSETHVERHVGMKAMDTVKILNKGSHPGKVGWFECVKWKGGSWCGPSWMPADPLLSGLFAGPLNRAQAQRGILGNCPLGSDKSPSATLWKVSGPSTSLMLDHNTNTWWKAQMDFKFPWECSDGTRRQTEICKVPISKNYSCGQREHGLPCG